MPNHKPITPEDDHELIRIIMAYLHGEKIETIKFQLKTRCNESDIACKHLYALITSNNKNIDYAETIRNILHELSEKQVDIYLNAPNLYEALIKLSIQHPHLMYLITLIDKAKPARNWPLYFITAAGVSAATSFFFYLKENIVQVKAWYAQTFPVVNRWLHNTVHLLTTTPLFGILSRLIPLIQSWYQAINDGSISHTSKLIKLGFNTITHSLPIMGYVLCYLAAGVMTVPAVALFITGASLEVIESLYTLIQNELERGKKNQIHAADYFSATTNARADNVQEWNRYKFLIQFVANLLLMASVVIWCVFPPSLVIAIPCMVFGWLVVLAKDTLLVRAEDEYADALQKNIREISTAHTREINAVNTFLFKQPLPQIQKSPTIQKNASEQSRGNPASLAEVGFFMPKRANIQPHNREPSDIAKNFGYN